MASEGECDAAFRSLADLLADLDAEVLKRYVLDRTVSCRVTDLDLTWSARVCEQGLIDLAVVDPLGDSRSQVRLSVGSDDLLALVDGRLGLPVAVATGRLRVQANPLDLLRLGAFL